MKFAVLIFLTKRNLFFRYIYYIINFSSLQEQLIKYRTGDMITKSTRTKLWAFVLIVMLALMSGCDTGIQGTPAGPASSTDELSVHFIDTGQSDCTLICMPNGRVSLIDAGDRQAASAITSYLDSIGIERIDWLILTHPHEDHIGSALEVIERYSVSEVYMPDVVANTKIFESTVAAIKEANSKAVKAEGGMSIFRDDDISFEILSPNGTGYDDLNNYSVVTRLKYGDTSFLFTGDAEAISEDEMLSAGRNLDSDLLKVGHHGSRTSSTVQFLNRVSPEFAVILCGEGNDYGHPHREALNRLSECGAKIYRTDVSGTIVAVSDGKLIKLDKEPVDYTYVAEPLIGNLNSHVFHRQNCSGLPAEKNRIVFDSRSEAEAAGYTPCGRCKP